MDDAITVELVRLVDRLKREDCGLAGLAGSLQQRLASGEDHVGTVEAPRKPARPKGAVLTAAA